MATIKDIARITGVSATTVSNVVHGRSNRVSAETVEKINNAIKELGYVPNMSARSLVAGSSKVIGFINHVVTDDNVNFLEDPFHSAAIGIIEHILRENGYYLMLRTVKSSDDLIEFLRNWNVAGLFFVGMFEDDFFETIKTLNVPVVLIDSYVHSKKLCNVGLEDYNGSFLATKHLIENGHKRIAFASPAIKEGGVLMERFLGYKAALLQNGITFDPSLVGAYEMDVKSCEGAAKQIAAMEGVTGIVVTADIMAAGIMAGLKRIGKDVPRDYSIVGFDDVNTCLLTSPTLTTIHQDMRKKGQKAVDYMIDLLEGNPIADYQTILPVSLVSRNSVRNLL